MLRFARLFALAVALVSAPLLTAQADHFSTDFSASKVARQSGLARYDVETRDAQDHATIDALLDSGEIKLAALDVPGRDPIGLFSDVQKPVFDCQFSAGGWSYSAASFTAPGTGCVVPFSQTTLTTMFGADGLLTFGPNNKFTQSNTPSNAAWTNANSHATFTTGIADPFGGTNATTVTASGGLVSLYQTPSVLVGTNYLTSIWLRRRTGSGTVYILDVNENSHAVTLTSSWQPFYIVAAATNTSATGIEITTTSDAVDMYGGTFSAVTHETTPRAQDQVITLASAYYGPRLDYNPATLAANGLLIEQASTNLALQSNALSNWGITNATIATTGAVTSPDGSADAFIWTDNSTSGVHRIFETPPTTVANTAYTASIYIKMGTLRYFVLALYSNSTANAFVAAVYDLQAGTVTQTGVGSSTGTLVNSGITSVGRGWWRIFLTGSVNVTDIQILMNGALSGTGNIFLGASGLISYVGTGQTVYLYGAQQEALAFPTSYIPTGASQVSRAADVATATLPPGQTGALYAKFVNGPNVGNAAGVATFYSSDLNEIDIRNAVYANGNTGGTPSWGGSAGTARAAGSVNKVLESWSPSAVKVYTNGTTTTSFTPTHGIPTGISKLYLGQLGATAYFANGWLGEVRYYNFNPPNGLALTSGLN